jgi:hypothetical protein
VGDVVTAEHGEILRRQPGLVPNLDSVFPAPRQRAKEAIKVRDEIVFVLDVLFGEGRELEDERADVFFEGLARTQEEPGKQRRPSPVNCTSTTEPV